MYGVVVDAEMQLNDAGRMVEHWWYGLVEKFAQVDLDEHITMPNHFHGIVIIVHRGKGAPMCVPSSGGSDAASFRKNAPLSARSFSGSRR